MCRIFLRELWCDATCFCSVTFFEDHVSGQTDVWKGRLKIHTKIPRHRLSTVGRRSFAVHGAMVCNSLPDDLRTQQDFGSFKQGLKTCCFLDTSVHSALETFATIALNKLTYIPYHTVQPNFQWHRQELRRTAGYLPFLLSHFWLSIPSSSLFLAGFPLTQTVYIYKYTCNGYDDVI